MYLKLSLGTVWSNILIEFHIMKTKKGYIQEYVTGKQ